MSMEIQTNFAPLNSTIDADRDYSDMSGLAASCGCDQALMGLEACGCGGPRPRMIPPGMHGLGEEPREESGLSAPLVIGLLLLFSAFVTIRPDEPAYEGRYE